MMAAMLTWCDKSSISGSYKREHEGPSDMEQQRTEFACGSHHTHE